MATAIECDLALATVASGDRDQAVSRLKALARVTCPFPAPADTTAVPVLLAFVEGLQPRRAAKALDRLSALERGASGATRQLLETATRVVALTAAEDAYRNNKLGPAKKFLATARKAEARAGADELAHDLAVVDVADGRLDTAIAALERLAPKVPEALINLGVAHDKQGRRRQAPSRPGDRRARPARASACSTTGSRPRNGSSEGRHEAVDRRAA